MLPSIFIIHNVINGSHDLVEMFKRYAPLGLRLRRTDEGGYTIAYDHTLNEFMYYSIDVEETMSASWDWLSAYYNTFEVTQVPTLPLQKLH